MSNVFKILIELNNEKYSIFIESDFKLIPFNSVYKQISLQTKQNISFESHLFELFDLDFNEYVLITNEKQIVTNLSRIRVKPKPDQKPNPDSNSTDIEEKIKLINVCGDEPRHEEQEAMASGLDRSLVQNNLNNELFFEKKCQKFDKNLMNNLVKEKNSDKESIVQNEDRLSISTDDTVVESIDTETIAVRGQASGKTQPKAINYLELELGPNYRTSSSSKILSYKTSIIDVNNESTIGMRYYFLDYKAIRQMLDLLAINRRSFERNNCDNSVSNPKWKTISDQMISNGFDDWSPQKCRDGLTNAMDLYKKSLDKCPNFDIADAINPLFFHIHSFDLKFIIGLSEFNSVKDLRKEFENKNKRNHRKYGLIERRFGSNLSLVTMNADFENQKKMENKSVIDRAKLRKMQKMTDFDINSFKALAKCVDTIVAQFGPVSNVKHFWELVSNQMKANGYKNSDAFTSRNVFTEYICDYYALVLMLSPDYKSATEIYRLFEFIHTMDLSQSLSYLSFQKIKGLREKFGKK